MFLTRLRFPDDLSTCCATVHVHFSQRITFDFCGRKSLCRELSNGSVAVKCMQTSCWKWPSARRWRRRRYPNVHLLVRPHESSSKFAKYWFNDLHPTAQMVHKNDAGGIARNNLRSFFVDLPAVCDNASSAWPAKVATDTAVVLFCGSCKVLTTVHCFLLISLLTGERRHLAACTVDFPATPATKAKVAAAVTLAGTPRSSPVEPEETSRISYFLLTAVHIPVVYWGEKNFRRV